MNYGLKIPMPANTLECWGEFLGLTVGHRLYQVQESIDIQIWDHLGKRNFQSSLYVCKRVGLWFWSFYGLNSPIL